MLVLLTDNCQPIRPAGSDPAGTLTPTFGVPHQPEHGHTSGGSSTPHEVLAYLPRVHADSDHDRPLGRHASKLE